MPDTPPLPLNCTTREAGLIAIGELAVTRRLPTATVKRIEPGCLLWIREPFHLPNTAAELSPSQYVSNRHHSSAQTFVHYAADGPAPGSYGTMRFARSMPRELSRLVLTVSAIRFERLQAIDDQAAQDACFRDRAAFAAAWDEMVGKGIRTGDADRWDGNPTVAVVEFTSERRMIGAVEQRHAEFA